jgi:hypothetical protein
VAVLLVDQPKNVRSVFTKLVVFAESVELHVGKVMLEPVVHVKVTAPDVIAVFFIFPPVAPLPFNVIVLVFALQLGFAVLLLDTVYPVEHVAL